MSSIYLAETASIQETLDLLATHRNAILTVERNLTLQDAKKVVIDRAPDTPVRTRFFHLTVPYGAWFGLDAKALQVEHESSAVSFDGDTILLHTHHKEDEWCRVVFKPLAEQCS